MLLGMLLTYMPAHDGPSFTHVTLRFKIQAMAQMPLSCGHDCRRNSTCPYTKLCSSTGEAQSLLRQRQQELRDGPPKEPAEGAAAGIGSKAESTVL